MLWNDILKEVMERKANGQRTDLFGISEYKPSCINTRKNHQPDKKFLATYKLGPKYGNRYFTKREAECMILLLKGKTLDSVATILKISPRTVEYYVKNMKSKIGCRTKFELIDLVYASDFMKNYKQIE